MTEEIKRRISMINSGEVPPGYKKTKIGIVPIEWKDTHFAKLFISTNDYTEDLAKYPLYSLTIEDGIVAKSERYERSHLVKKEDAYKIVRPHDFAYNPMNIRFGAVARYKGDFEVCVSGYYNIFTTIDKRDLDFMDNYLLSYPMIQYYNKVSTGSLIEKQRVHFSQFINFRLPLPKIEERAKIAEILTTCDKIIELKEKLITEKQQQKKWLIQNLFAGTKRLAGFDGEWKWVRLNKICLKKTNKNVDSKIKTVLTNSALNGLIKQGEYFDRKITNDDNISSYYIVDENDFVYNPRISNNAPCGPINTNDLGIKGIVSPLYTVFSIINREMEQYFLKVYFESNFWHYYMFSIANYGVRFDRMNITDKEFFQMLIPFPTNPEQTTISNILINAEKEIELLQKELTEWNKKKKALMQLLLTGIVRVNT
jgi:type I restriction enzyme S subunit